MNDGTKKAVGTIIAAIIAGIFLLISVGKIPFPFFEDKATATLYPTYTPFPTSIVTVAPTRTQLTSTLQPNATATQVSQTTTLPTPTPRLDILPNGEIVSAKSLAGLIGGSSAYWTKRGPVVWGYWDEGHNVIFRHPGGNTILTYWAGFPEPRNADGCLIIVPESDNQTRYVKCSSGTAAEFESDGAGFHLVDYTGFFK